MQPDSDSSPTRILLVEDHAAILNMLTSVVTSDPAFTVVGGAVNATEAVRICRKHPVDVLVLDLMLPGVSGLALLMQLHAIQPKMRVLIFSGNLSPTVMRELLRIGVLGAVEKSAPLEMFIHALRAVAKGQTYYGTFAGELIRECLVPEKDESDNLTEREKIVLGLMAEGLSSKEIAGQLRLSVHTIINYRTSLMKKTGLHRVAQLSRYAAERGLVGEKSKK